MYPWTAPGGGPACAAVPMQSPHASTTPQTAWGDAKSPFSSKNANNWVFAKMATELAKTKNPDAQFIWNMPYFNVNGTSTDLSLGLKSTFATSTYITSGSRPDFDMAQARRMLIIDNKNGGASEKSNKFCNHYCYLINSCNNRIIICWL